MRVARRKEVEAVASATYGREVMELRRKVEELEKRLEELKAFVTPEVTLLGSHAQQEVDNAS